MPSITARIAEDNSECFAECREAMETEKEREMGREKFGTIHSFTSIILHVFFV